MGYGKRGMERDQELYNLGLDLCVEVGALKQCDVHEGTYYDGDEEVTEAYKLANKRITDGEIELEAGETRETVTDAIKGAYDDNSNMSICSACDAIRRKD